ncbi:hypothetical protein BSU04_03510 [Caballeronia sordidicola]|jgi:hypothetical protein|uniref:Uncharacterized protein n=1 Tax=Caballeronia sordidicola TaxID=196367 RepID=A0A226XAS8_CABSO|nr:hypothetical protein BSU04_03510 [Caballeronia sordidicola]
MQMRKIKPALSEAWQLIASGSASVHAHLRYGTRDDEM